MSNKRFESGTCIMCEKHADELCQDFVCRGCHVSCSWEDCVTGTFNAEMMLRNGHDPEYVSYIYPDAKIGR